MFYFERAEKPEETPKGGESQRDLRKFAVVQGGRKREEGRIQRIENAIVLEEKIFSKEDVSTLIENAAVAEGFKKEDLVVAAEEYDGKGNLIGLKFQIKMGRAKGTGFGRVTYEYTIRGMHGKGKYEPYSAIIRIAVPYNNPDNPQKNVVAKFDSGAWKSSAVKIVAPRGDIKYTK